MHVFLLNLLTATVYTTPLSIAGAQKSQVSWKHDVICRVQQ